MKTRKLNGYYFGIPLWLFVAGAAMLLGAQVKPQAKAVVKPGILSGRVFLMTEAGDLNPARMADVWLFYMYRSVEYANAHKEDQNSAALEWINENIKALEAQNKANEWGCIRSLSNYSDATGKTLDWAGKTKDWQIILGHADEEGNFRISVPRPGDYLLLIQGRAGFNNAVWQTHPITIRSGLETTVKMSSPEKACVVTSD